MAKKINENPIKNELEGSAFFRKPLDTDSQDTVKQTQWNAFIKKFKPEESAESLDEIITNIRDFLSLPVEALHKKESLRKTWPPGGPWKKNK